MNIDTPSLPVEIRDGLIYVGSSDGWTPAKAREQAAALRGSAADPIVGDLAPTLLATAAALEAAADEVSA